MSAIYGDPGPGLSGPGRLERIARMAVFILSFSRWVELWDFLPRVGKPDFQTYASWTLGQEMHTPNAITDPDPPLDDQPNAGVLYADNTFHVRRDRWGHTWNVRLGVVGPASQADQLQTWFHDVSTTDG